MPGAGDVLTAGTHRLTATFTPADTADYTTAQAAVSFAITKATPSITWPRPDPITYGDALSDAQLNANASVPGTFAYIPGAGAVLSAGTHRPSAIFTPADATNFTVAKAAVPLTVTKATPAITWPAPSDIAYGVALSSAQLNATASVPGTFAYTPTLGEKLTAGVQTLSVTFTPADIADYTTAQAAVSLNVTGATATVLAWPEPPEITYGTPLSAAQLNATAPVPGMFEYSPAAGDVLPVGTRTLSVTFTPADSNLPTAHASVQLVVTKATPAITWPKPADIIYGTPLNSAQLNATAPVEGSFAYTPSEGEVLGAGTRTLSVTFTPEGTADYEVAQAVVSLTITKAKPAITWPKPDPIPYGTALSTAQLNAKASVEGTFAYTPGPGNVLTAGKQTLSTAFTPADIADYTTAQASVPLVIEGLPDLDLFEQETVDEENEDRTQPLQADGMEEEERIGYESQASSQSAGTQTPVPAADAADRTAESKRGGLQSTPPTPQARPETRIYKGATYVKGADGQWHLQQK
jgi:hypothetical protein